VRAELALARGGQRLRGARGQERLGEVARDLGGRFFGVADGETLRPVGTEEGYRT
jgi:hypothetical protein